MSGNTIIGKVFNGRVIDRGVEMENGLIEIGFTDNTFERIHRNDFDGFVASLEDGVTPEVTELEAEANDDDLTEVEVAPYKLLADIPYTDEHGVEQGVAEEGSVQEVPVELGDAWVEQGLAEKVEVIE
jgi:hypothetical protein